MVVTDASGDTVSANVTVGESIGIEDIGFADGIKIYPNPNRGVFVFTIYDLRFTNGELTIYDMLGCIISKTKIVNRTSEIDISDYQSGIYHLQIITDKVIVNRKVVIE